MLLTDAQLHEIRQIIADHHNAFVVNTISPEAVEASVLERLKAIGLVNVQVASIADAYILGQILAAAKDPKVARMSYDEFRAYLKQNPVPLSPVERRAISVAQHTAAQYAVGLGRRVDTDTGATLLGEDQALASRMRDSIRTSTAESIARRETARQLKSKLGWATRDWARDWDRIAITEMHNARERGAADVIAEDFGGGSFVAKRVSPDACDACRELHLKNGYPRIFKLSELEKNGTNFKKKKSQWKAVVGSVHPHCFTGGTLITTARGEVPIEKVLPGDLVLSHDGTWNPITHTWASVYSGEVIEVRVGDRTLTATPEHPFYVDGEWLPAKSLDQVRNLQGFGGKIDGSLLVDLDSAQLPTLLPQNRHFATVLFGFTRGGVPVTAIDFHGELYVREGQINHAQIQQIAGGRVQSDGEEGVVDPAFRFRAKFAGIRFEDAQDEFPGLLLTPDRSVESGNIGPPLFWRHAGHSYGASSALTPLNVSGSMNSINDSTTANPQLESYLLYRQQILEVAFEDEVGIQFSPVVPNGSIHSGFVSKPHPIVNVLSRNYRGVVYNLSVENTKSYVAEGVSVHNCRCTLVRVPDGWGFDEDGVLVPGGKFGVRYRSQEDMELAVQEERDLVKSAAQGHVTFQGLPITIENTPGTIREWRDDAGNKGSTLMLFAYGYLDGTDAMDGDELDVYVGPDPRAENAYIIHQQNPKTGIYDESKVMLGFSHEQQAVQAYRYHFDKPDNYILDVTPMGMDQFKRWAASSADQGSVLRKGQRAERFVIPLQKSELVTESGHIDPAAVTTRAGDRAPGPGIGANYIFPVPQRDSPPAKMEDKDMHMTPREMLEESTHRKNAVKRDKRVYHYKEPINDPAKPIEIPDNFKDFIVLDEEAAEERKEHLIREGLRNTRRPKNKVDVE